MSYSSKRDFHPIKRAESLGKMGQADPEDMVSGANSENVKSVTASSKESEAKIPMNYNLNVKNEIINVEKLDDSPKKTRESSISPRSLLRK